MSAGRTGSVTVNLVPTPTFDWTSMRPPWLSMILYEIERPSPVPLPTSLVVKNGSKIFGRTSGGMPCPLSANSTAHPLGVGLERAHGNDAAVLGGSLGGVGEEIQEHLVHLRRRTGNPRDPPEDLVHLAVLELVLRDRQGRGDTFVQVELGDLTAVESREVLQVRDQLGDLADAV